MGVGTTRPRKSSPAFIGMAQETSAQGFRNSCKETSAVLETDQMKDTALLVILAVTSTVDTLINLLEHFK